MCHFFAGIAIAPPQGMHTGRVGEKMSAFPDKVTTMAGSWGCPHEVEERCTKVNLLPCNPGMKGCELAGRFRFANEDKNDRFYEKQARKAAADTDTKTKDSA